MVHDTPEHNGVAECLNRTIMEKVRAMLLDSDLLKFLWAEAASHAVYLKNRTWTWAIGDTTPYEILVGSKPNLSNLHPWGCKVRVHSPGGSKLDSRSSVGWWMGFDVKTRDGHRVYWLGRRTVSVEQSVRFNFEAEEVVVRLLLLEGERMSSKHLTAIEPEPEKEVVIETENEAVDNGEIREINPPEGRPK